MLHFSLYFWGISLAMEGMTMGWRQEKVRKAIKRVVHASFDTEPLGFPRERQSGLAKRNREVFHAKHGLTLCFSALCTISVCVYILYLFIYISISIYIYIYVLYLYVYIYIRCTSQQTWLDPDRARLNTQRGFNQIFSPTFRVTQVLNWPSLAPQILSWCKKKLQFH